MQTWDLSDLYSGVDDPAIAADVAAIDALIERFVADCAGEVDNLLDALRRYEQIIEGMEKLFEYAQMVWTTDTRNGALMARIEGWRAQCQQRLLPFELYVQAAHDTPEPYRHWLEVKRQQQPYRLSEAEEIILAEKAVTGRKAWLRYADEINASRQYEIDGETLAAAQLYNQLAAPDRDERARAYHARSETVHRLEHAYTFIYNTIVADKASEDRLRGYPTWITSFNLANEVSDEAVRVLADAVAARYDLAQRIFRLKRDLLGLDDFYVFDISAPLPEYERTYTWEEAQAIVLDAFTAFDADFAAIARRFFTERWIDAAPGSHRYDGAFCAVSVPSVHPYVFMNFTGAASDVQTLAHELGHGVHFCLCREQGQLQYMMPLPVAETASTFCEALVYDSLLQREPDPQARLALLVHHLERVSSTIFYQIVMHRFEDAMHRTHRQDGWLSGERLGDLWIEHYQPMAGDVLTVTEDNRMGWVVPHFLMVPGYIYAYAFGELLAQSLAARYREMGAAFVPHYMALLRAGGSDSPENLLRPLGIDLTDPAFWHGGLAQIEALVAQAEQSMRDARLF